MNNRVSSPASLFRIFISAAVICLAINPSSRAAARGQVVLKSSITPDRVNIGDPIEYSVSVTSPPGSGVEFHELPAPSAGDFEVEPVGTLEEASGRPLRFIIRGYETGTFSLPPASVTVRLPDGSEEKLTADSLKVTIESLLEPTGGEGDIRDIKPPVSLKVSYAWLAYLAAVAAVSVILAVFLVRIFSGKKKKTVPLPPPRPAHEIAYGELERIRKADLPGRGMIKEYYTRLSNVVRHYLENRFGLRAPERTTEEFLHEAAATDFLTIPQQDLVGDFLVQADLVKFARYGPTGREIDDVYKAAVRLIDETKETEETRNPNDETRKREGKIGMQKST